MKTLQILADPSSLMKNITKFFSNSHAHIQELLQNARRAEATEVKVDVSADKITVSDNGHGVYSPQRLITIGGSEWHSKVECEVPAGMGLFSCFQLCNIITVRSADWLLTLNYEKLCAGIGPTLEEGMKIIHGTTIELLDPKIDGEYLDHELTTSYNTSIISTVAKLAINWADTALFMPFKTIISIEGGKNPHSTKGTLKSVKYNPSDDLQSKTLYKQNGLVVEAFDITIIDKKTYKKDFTWGEIRVSAHSKYRRCSGDKNTIRIITQGIQITEYQNTPPEIDLVVYIKPGCVDLRLPDRDQLISNDKTTKIIEEAKEGIAKVLIDMLNSNDFVPMEDRWLAAALYDLDKTLMWSIPAKKRCVKARDSNHYEILLYWDSVAKKQGLLTQNVDDIEVLQYFLNKYFVVLHESDEAKAFAEELHPDTTWYTDIYPEYIADPRADDYECVYILERVTCVNSERSKKHLYPSKSESILVHQNDITDEEVSNAESEFDLALIHTTPVGPVNAPELDILEDFKLEGHSVDEIWDNHPIRDFLNGLKCSTFITDGNIHDVKQSFYRYAGKEGKLVDCTLNLDKWGSNLKIEFGYININGELTKFWNQDGEASFEEPADPADLDVLCDLLKSS